MANRPNYRLLPTTFLASVAITSNACVIAAAGAGAGGAVYVTDREVDSQLALPVDAAYEAVRKAFHGLGIAEGKYSTEHEGAREERTLTGRTPDREVSVKVKSEGAGSRISVTVRHDEVIWDKKFARTIVERIVEESRAK
ncbi:MAG: DUF3568 family protein [Gemmatimonadales bacterium]